MIPSILKNMNAFVDGKGYAGLVEELVLPKLTRKLEEYRAGGMDAPIDIDMGHEKLEATFTFAEHDADLFALWGIADNAAVPFQMRGAMQRDSDGVVTGHVVDIRGRFKEIDQGNWKAGEKAPLVCAVTASYYRITIGGKVLIEIDVPNMICVVGGVDLLATQRAALGL